ncbi:MAG: ATP phosphoribosyltransferase regulatory subunit [Actinobacteria bacterium]|nr:ATP phosphoribosyltransferase regulatory subunit [Actinomycetota bacterium]MBI3687752.1 ATP phosphoribosyltransferase regulatory subunit [Actinomycetota bacterium]
MSQYLPTVPYRGTRDFLPAEMSVRQQVFHRLFEVIERYGFARYDGPILEAAEIYEAKSGREIADLQLYTLTDRGGRRLALRPEMTPSVARMIAGNANSLQFPVRWYCHVNCHRYERPQRGRVREHWQINVDIFGSDHPTCESVLADLSADVLDRSRLVKLLAGPARDLVTFDPLIVRAFEYYTSTVFEVFDHDPANNRSLFGGGRYGDLVGLFSDKRIPGFGFGMGDVTLFDFLDTHGLLPQPRAEADVVVIPTHDDLCDDARTVGRQLRQAGWNTSLPLEPRKLGKEIARADKAGARAVVIIGPEDWKAGNLVVRNLTTGDQETAASATVTDVATGFLTG